jgi:molybdate transport system ATP-binding protein
LSCAQFSGGQLWLPRQTATLGRAVRIRIQARDVSLSLVPQQGTSILNIIPVTVIAISEDAPGQVMVALDAGGTRILSRITRKSAVAMKLAPGNGIYAQIKGVAILR